MDRTDPGALNTQATPAQTPGAMAAQALAQWMNTARSGQMPLVNLLDVAQQWAQAGQVEASAALYETWLAHTQSPQRPIALFNWGTTLGGLGRHAQAEQAYREALALQPQFIQAHLNLGHQLEHLGQPDEALACWRKVLALVDEQKADLELKLHALNNMARLLEQLRRYDESEACMVDSLRLKAEQPRVVQHYVHIRQKQCEWPVYQPVGVLTANQLLLGTSPLAMLSASDDPALHLLTARTFCHERVLPLQTPLAASQRRPGKVRLGYLSGDLHMHAVGLLTVDMLELHNHDEFEVFAFCWSTEDGTPLRQRLLKSFDHVVPLRGLSDEAAARAIAAHDIDILIDLQGLTNGARPDILSWRPARQQVTYLGFPATTGLPAIDWVIADRFVMPESVQPYMTEKPLYLPRCYQASDRQRPVGPLPRRADYQLPEDAFVYCSFNNNFKFTQEMFSLWMRVLHAVPNSVLWLLADNAWAKANMQRCASEHGVNPDRLIFAPRVAPPDYLARFTLADLFLDTFPYNAGTTANDVLFMGVPLLTLSGRTYISRMAGSLLHHVGLPDLITEDMASYERKAVQLGQNPQRVASLRRYLAEHRMASSLFDMPGFVKDLETALKSLVLG
jgi:predicted O-linked N-acetylglucosamine transferase (SPINDLY family)